MRIIILIAFLLLFPGQAEAPLGVLHIPQTQPETYLLARLIYTEARGESFEGQVAVGAVVMNRVKSPEFPNSITKVINQKNQFAEVANNFNAESLRAAEEAINGTDPTNGALFFYNPKTSTDDWIFTRETICEIGNHRFSKGEIR